MTPEDDSDILTGWVPPQTVIKGQMFTDAALARRDREAREAALEEAARVAEKHRMAAKDEWANGSNWTAIAIGNAIRALKESK